MAKIPDSVPWIATGTTLGGGGQGQVVQVTPKNGSTFPPVTKHYAMKILRNVGSDQAKERFRREISAIQKITDSRIVKVIDYSKEETDFQYYVMPYYSESCYGVLEKLMLSPDSTFFSNPRVSLEFIAECAEALNRVHGEGIVHRDIKPANILVENKSLNPVILDFGCCQMDGDEVITMTDEGVGTPNYMAPECEHGASGSPTFQADIYSLGKILWSIIAGQRAFARESPAFTTKNLSKVLNEKPDCWHVTRIFEHTIRRKPKDRYGSAQELAKDCRWISQGLIGKYPPLELVKQLCPVCGQKEMVSSSKEYDVSLHCVFGNPMPHGTKALQCTVCGYLAAWDTRPLANREKKLKEME